jgi:hypothetical protein
MHPAIFPEFKIVSGGLAVKESCSLGAFDGNVMGERITVSDLWLCRETAGGSSILVH